MRASSKRKWTMASAESLRRQTGNHAKHVVARLSGVSAEDSKIEGARKVVETMEMAFGADHPKVKQARRLYERAKARAEK
jgi:hypothetical protein